MEQGSSATNNHNHGSGAQNHVPVLVAQDGPWKQYMVGGHSFIVDNKYELVKVIGIGAYGLVWYVVLRSPNLPSYPCSLPFLEVGKKKTSVIVLGAIHVLCC
jgi:hypothetical protein